MLPLRITLNEDWRSITSATRGPETVTRGISGQHGPAARDIFESQVPVGTPLQAELRVQNSSKACIGERAAPSPPLPRAALLLRASVPTATVSENSYPGPFQRKNVTRKQACIGKGLKISGKCQKLVKVVVRSSSCMRDVKFFSNFYSRQHKQIRASS